jgi:hypothetical protein
MSRIQPLFQGWKYKVHYWNLSHTLRRAKRRHIEGRDISIFTNRIQQMNPPPSRSHGNVIIKPSDTHTRPTKWQRLASAIPHLPETQENKSKSFSHYKFILAYFHKVGDRLCGLVVTDPEVGVRFSALSLYEKQWVWNGVHSASWVQLRT